MNPNVQQDEVTCGLDCANYALSTLSVHADDILNTATDVAPALHVSTTFRYPERPEDLRPVNGDEVPSITDAHVYSRLTAPNSTRLEVLLSSLLHGHVLTYTSGLSAFHALLVYFAPKVVAISGGYHGCHGVLAIHRKLTNVKIVDLFNEEEWDAAGLGAGDLVHVETPVNPTGEARNLEDFVAKARKRGAIVSVDATFGPPGLQDPFVHGVDVVMHSGTKYIGGHSDLLLGVLAVKKKEWYVGLGTERVFLGSVPGSLEGWLGVRSLRTLELRVQRQSQNADKLVAWLDEGLRGEGPDAEVIKAAVDRVVHASLQKEDMGWLKKQMPNGFGPVFAIYLSSPEAAKTLPSKLTLFHHATSLGGVESLIEWRRMSDEGVDPRLLRISAGVENWEDLKNDLLKAFKAQTKKS